MSGGLGFVLAMNGIAAALTGGNGGRSRRYSRPGGPTGLKNKSAVRRKDKAASKARVAQRLTAKGKR